MVDRNIERLICMKYPTGNKYYDKFFVIFYGGPLHSFYTYFQHTILRYSMHEIEGNEINLGGGTISFGLFVHKLSICTYPFKHTHQLMY